jgi:SAM-dependent methyltransferase
MTNSRENRFEDFFADEAYVALKNHLYNYRLRRRAINRCLAKERIHRILEVGSGLSPMLEASDRIVYSELSFPALRMLKKNQGLGSYVVADASHLPFKAGSFSQVICSEVLEHLPEDQSALHEMAAAMSPRGSLILTFPHRRFYFALDDRFVNHFRRYELDEMEAKLAETGLSPVEVQKVLGPLEKVTMWSVVLMISIIKSFENQKGTEGPKRGSGKVISKCFQWFNRLYALPVRLDAFLAPRRLAAVLLVRAVKLP